MVLGRKIDGSRGHGPSPFTMNDHSVLLSVCTYDDESSLCHGDQILVPTRVWTAFDAKHRGSGPIFVSVCGDEGDETGIVGRLRPAVPADSLDEDCCRIPTADWMRLGAPMPGDLWTHVSATTLPTVGTITLRAHKERSLTALADPVVTLSAEIAAGWSCVTQGSELVLPCGSFDVMGLEDLGGSRIHAGCILNTDVVLELVPALDHRPPTPMPTPITTPVFGASLPSFSNAASIEDPRFPGRGYRLGSS
jgi:hypothetical protein